MTRIGGEGSDLSVSNKYLALTDNERSVLEAMKNGKGGGGGGGVNTLNTLMTKVTRF